MYRQPVHTARVVGYQFDTGERRVLCEINGPIHHVLAYDNERFVFCHPPIGMGMLMTDWTSGKYEYLRAGDPGVPVSAGDASTLGHVCHFVATRRGIVYDVIGPTRQRRPRVDRHSCLLDAAKWSVSEIRTGFLLRCGPVS